MVKYPDLKELRVGKTDLAYNCRLQSMLVGKSRQGLTAAGHTHSQDGRGGTMDP